MRAPFGLIIFALLCCMSVTACAQDTPPPHETFTVQSKQLGETRVINVYQAAGGNAASPLLVMPDGGTGEDFPHIAQAIRAGVEAGRMQPVVLVGIENTERRRDMTGPTTVASDRKIAPVVGGSEKFRAFIRDELLPEVEKRYGAHRRRGIIGESAAGLFIVETLFLEPALFTDYMAISPSLWWNKAFLARADGAAVPALSQPANLYLTGADESDIAPHTQALAAKLKAVKDPQLTLQFVPRPDLKHATIYRAVAPGILEKMYPPATP